MWTAANPPDQSKRKRYRWREGQCLHLRATGMTPRRQAGKGGTMVWRNARTGDIRGAFQWAFSRRVRGGDYMLLLANVYDAHAPTQRIQLRSDRIAYTGSERWWLSCPSCDGRCRGLFKTPRSSGFACRTCANVQYDSRLRAHPKRRLQRLGFQMKRAGLC